MDKQNQSSETPHETDNQEKTTEKTLEKAAKIDRLANLASLLDEEPPKGRENDEQDGEDEDENEDDEDKKHSENEDKSKEKQKSDNSKKSIKTFNDLSKALGIEKKDLYGVKLVLNDQETVVSIGELKDAYQDSSDLSFEKIEWGERKSKEEQELSRARQELEVLVSLVPKESLKKEQVEAAAKVVQSQLERAKKDLHRRVPEWDDAELKKQEGKEIDEYLADYGVRLSKITDPAVIHYIRNSWLRDKRLNEALAKIKKVETKTSGPGGKTDRSKNTKGRTVTPKGKMIARDILGQLED